MNKNPERSTLKLVRDRNAENICPRNNLKNELNNNIKFYLKHKLEKRTLALDGENMFYVDNSAHSLQSDICISQYLWRIKKINQFLLYISTDKQLIKQKISIHRLHSGFAADNITSWKNS